MNILHKFVSLEKEYISQIGLTLTYINLDFFFCEYLRDIVEAMTSLRHVHYGLESNIKLKTGFLENRPKDAPGFFFRKLAFNFF